MIPRRLRSAARIPSRWITKDELNSHRSGRALVSRTRSESEANMTRTARQPHKRLTLGVGLVAALIWTSLGLRAIVMDNDPSTKALFAFVAMVLAGFAVCSATWILTAARRAARPADAVMLAEMKATFAMLGVMLIGLGADPILDRSTSVWGWISLVFASLGGGMNLSIAFMGIADQPAASDGRRQATGAS